MCALEFDPSGAAVPTLAALHGLRLTGFVDTATLVDLLAHIDPSIDPDGIETELDRLADAGLVARRAGPASVRWSLTSAGRAEHERLLAEQLDATGRRADVEQAYRDFLALNPKLLDVCTRWQVRDIEASLVNDHTDPAYDAAVIQALVNLDAKAQPIVARLADVLHRFGRYGPALTAAVDRVRAGDTDWFARPLIASYHTVWFELHEDLLATLGLERTPTGPAAAVG